MNWEAFSLNDFDNILVTNHQGLVIFYDVADLNVLRELGQKPEDMLGKNVTTFYKNLTHENSTVMRVLRSGEALCNERQEMITNIDNEIISISSTYPIKEEGGVVGAIEFSKRYYKKEHIQSLDKYAGHKIYRKNNTVYTIDDIVTRNPKMAQVKERIKTIAKTSSTLLIYGETGTGKEMVVQAIHNLSDRFSNPFISFNCSAVPESLMESTLFGTVKGSFTGAENMPGLFEQAQGGTLFLDEINSLPINMQVKFLKAIEEKTIRRIGGKRNIPLDVRIIAATNEDPEKLLSEKRLRDDLFYRLSVVQLDLPTLADRKEDVELLLGHYIDFYNAHMDMKIERVHPDVLRCFNDYHWPGNVREFKNAVETAYNHVRSTEMTMEDIPPRINRQWMRHGGSSTGDTVQTEHHLPNYTDHSLLNEARENQQVNIAPNNTSLKSVVDHFEKEIIAEHLHAANGVIAETARRLGVSKQSLKYKMEKYQLK